MGKFNRSKAEQIVTDMCNRHITENGNVVYEPSGYLPYENGSRINGMKDYHNFRGTIIKELRKVFDPTPTYGKFINVYMGSVIRKSGIQVGICRFDSKSVPTYTEPKDIKPITIEVVRDNDIISLEEFIETI
jgi:hypothetical protein